ncbi:unnamed protein product [Soboliphyme baturini]|uniref:Musculoskeletal embryonic nuclear protein 1 n=1 Tax=Soboliphyme baturini TaxID=241478 RepID=A0A183J249_9BILA|nr:unnamed protein product [Soboliphyme baturini]
MLEREDAELQSKWDCLRSAWENHRIAGVQIPVLAHCSMLGKSLAAVTTVTDTGCEYSSPVHSTCPPAVSEARLPQPTACRSSLKSSVSSADVYRRFLVPPYLQGSSVHGGRLADQTVKQQLPSKLLKDDMFNSISAKFPGTVKEKKKKKSKAKEDTSSGDAASRNTSGGKQKK